MQLECPACGKANELDSSSTCERCGSDLSRLRGVLLSASWHLCAAAERVRSGAWQEALTHAERSWKLRNSAEAARLAFLLCAALGHSGRAARWHGDAHR